MYTEHNTSVAECKMYSIDTPAEDGSIKIAQEPAAGAIWHAYTWTAGVCQGEECPEEEEPEEDEDEDEDEDNSIRTVLSAIGAATLAAMTI